MTPYVLNCKERSPNLFELSDGTYQIVDAYLPTLIMHDIHHNLFDKELLDFINAKIAKPLNSIPVVIIRRSTNEEFHNYYKLIDIDDVSHNELFDIDYRGYKIVFCHGAPFVSPQLRAALFKADFCDRLQFPGTAFGAVPVLDCRPIRRIVAPYF